MATTIDGAGAPRDAGVEPDDTQRSSDADAGPARVSGVYRAMWRWHFYAGLFVIPFLIMLASTGAIYLFSEQVDPILYRDLRTIPRPAEGAAARSLGEQVTAVEKAFPEFRVVSVSEPLYPTRTTKIHINPKDGWDQPADSWARARYDVYVHPYTAQVLGHQAPTISSWRTCVSCTTV